MATRFKCGLLDSWCGDIINARRKPGVVKRHRKSAGTARSYLFWRQRLGLSIR